MNVNYMILNNCKIYLIKIIHRIYENTKNLVGIVNKIINRIKIAARHFHVPCSLTCDFISHRDGDLPEHLFVYRLIAHLDTFHNLLPCNRHGYALDKTAGRNYH